MRPLNNTPFLCYSTDTKQWITGDSSQIQDSQPSPIALSIYHGSSLENQKHEYWPQNLDLKILVV